MNSRVARTLVPRLSSNGLMVLVIVLAFSFVAVVLIPGLELASGLTDTSAALKFAGQQQRNPAVIRAYLEPWCGTLERARHFERLLTAFDGGPKDRPFQPRPVARQ